MTLIIGLTGGIGSGKTLVSDRLAELGVPIIDTDVLAREIVEPGQPALAALAEKFGAEILLADGSLNRDRLRELAFSSSEAKADLDQITHPAIRELTISKITAVTYPYCVVVIPLLTADSAFSGFLQRTITVSADRELRIQRVMHRNDFSREQVLSIMQTQLTDAEREAFSDDVIENSGSKEAAIAATDELHQALLNLSQATSNERTT